MRIIIVEDEIKIREGLSKLIDKHTPHEIIGEAKDGEEGLELILRLKPDLVISDIRMPVMDGLEMLTRLNGMKVRIHAVILSGYSEFDYAKRAIGLNVKDYLLKPVTLEDVQLLLERMEKKIAEERLAQKGTPQSCIRDVILGSTEYDEETIRSICGFKLTMRYQMYLGYIGATRATYSAEYIERMELIRNRFPETVIHTIHMEATKEIVTLIAGEISYEEISDYFERRVLATLKGREEQTPWSAARFEKLTEQAKTYKGLKNIQKFGISIENDLLITRERISGLRKAKYRYPIEIENKIKAEICNGTRDKLDEYKNEFFLFMKNKGYEPASVVDGYMRLYTATANLLQEIDTKNYEILRQMNILMQISEARTRVELEKAYSEVIHLLVSVKEKREDIRNYTIKRTINYIRDHYKEGITLEETAHKLNITPEYLCTLFNRELGMNFSAFLTEFRLSHAKRLLKGTELKIYEIAAEVGYSDPKYFNRVFKEKYGVSPGEFRQNL
ncbi:MAG TPA: response regulator [Clostridiales bacterium]|nr:response regulator [Clostridiales bacterium]